MLGGWRVGDTEAEISRKLQKINPGLERGQLESHSLGLHIRDNREPVWII